MVTTRAPAARTVHYAGQEWIIGEPQDGWMQGTREQQMLAQDPAYRPYYSVGVYAIDYAAARSQASGKHQQITSLNAVLVRLGYSAAILPREVVKEPDEEVIRPMTAEERWAAKEREEAEGFRREQERARRLAAEDRAEVEDRDEGRWEPTLRETFPPETLAHRRANRPSDQPEGRRLRNLKQKVALGLFGSIREADEATPRRMTQREIAAERQQGRQQHD